MANPSQLFDRTDFDRLVTAERLLHDLLPKIDKAAACGIECDGYREIQKNALEMLATIKRQYFSEFLG